MHASAYRKVRAALRSGALLRPSECERCGISPPPCSDGRSRIQAHHEDYSKPLDVSWLCAKCHRAITPLPETMGAPNYGERNGFSRLTKMQVIDIRESDMGCRKLAKIYGVHKTTIQRVRRGETWKIA